MLLISLLNVTAISNFSAGSVAGSSTSLFGCDPITKLTNMLRKAIRGRNEHPWLAARNWSGLRRSHGCAGRLELYSKKNLTGGELFQLKLVTPE